MREGVACVRRTPQSGVGMAVCVIVVGGKRVVGGRGGEGGAGGAWERRRWKWRGRKADGATVPGAVLQR